MLKVICICPRSQSLLSQFITIFNLFRKKKNNTTYSNDELTIWQDLTKNKPFEQSMQTTPFTSQESKV